MALGRVPARATQSQRAGAVLTDEPDSQEPTPAELRAATIWKILRAAYLRVACDAYGKAPEQLTEPEQEGQLEKWHQAMAEDAMRLEECMRAAEEAGAGRGMGLLHDSSVREYDSHEMLDEALEFAEVRPSEEAPLMAHPRHASESEESNGND